jgi:probable H4MPT-linked C1 transfer pathway protein
MQFAGLDIGGANIKFATLSGDAQEISLPIWRDKDSLKPVLGKIAVGLPESSCLGVTMTAELADCFSNKQEGVEFVVDAVTDSFPDQQPLFYRNDGNMCDALTARTDWRSVAASNWHALAWLAFLDSQPHSGFMIDIGSTTTDIIPVRSGIPVVPGQTDLDRLSNGQLFYAGIGRTPVCSLLQEVQLETGRVTLARELFATMADVFLWRGLTRADPADGETADGRPATKPNAGQRLARMVCCDFDDLNVSDVDEIAIQAHQKLVQHLSGTLARVLSDHASLPPVFKTFGRGGWLVEEVISKTLTKQQLELAKIVPLSTDPIVNQSAAAYAVAKKREQVYLHRGSASRG